MAGYLGQASAIIQNSSPVKKFSRCNRYLEGLILSVVNLTNALQSLIIILESPLLLSQWLWLNWQSGSLKTPDVRGSNPVIGKIYIENLLSTVLKRRNKRMGNFLVRMTPESSLITVVCAYKMGPNRGGLILS